MNRKQLRKTKLACYRCGKRTSAARADSWNTEWKQGVFVGHLCPTCQTPEENAEAEINLATTDYSKAKVDAFGRVSVAPKVSPEDVELDPMVQVPLRCERCGDETTADKAPDWALNIEGGRLVEVVCAGCLTHEEHLAAEVNIVLANARVDDDGQIFTEPKQAPDDEL